MSRVVVHAYDQSGGHLLIAGEEFDPGTQFMTGVKDCEVVSLSPVSASVGAGKTLAVEKKEYMTVPVSCLLSVWYGLTLDEAAKELGLTLDRGKE